MRKLSMQEFEEDTKGFLAAAESGQRLVLIRSGRPVIEIGPAPEAAEEQLWKTEEQRLEAGRRLSAILDEGIDLGGVWNGRDELYDRDAAIQELDLLLSQGLDLGGVAPTRDEMHDGR